jgi:hypothetical protein
MDNPAIRARFMLFKSLSDPWDVMAQKVADFLTTLGPGRVIGVSHSQESSLGVIAVWYWEVDDAKLSGEPNAK